MVRGYYVNKYIWTAVVRDKFQYRKESRNKFDPFAVVVMRGETIIGHVTRKISSIFPLFLRWGGSITCCVTGDRCHSGNLVLLNHLIRCFYYSRTHI